MVVGALVDIIQRARFAMWNARDLTFKQFQ
jgi:hypothetical protein